MASAVGGRTRGKRLKEAAFSYKNRLHLIQWLQYDFALPSAKFTVCTIASPSNLHGTPVRLSDWCNILLLFCSVTMSERSGYLYFCPTEICKGVYSHTSKWGVLP